MQVGSASDQDQVRELAGFNRAELLLAMHHLRGLERRDPEDARGRDAGLHLQFELPIEPEPCEPVTARDQPDAALVQQPIHAEHRRKGISVPRHLVECRWKTGAQGRAARLQRQAIEAMKSAAAVSTFLVAMSLLPEK